MVAPLVVAIAEIAPELLADLTVGLAGAFGGSALAKTFDDTSKNICTCLDKIDKTLVSGFAGRDIESERLQTALDGVKADIAKTNDALKDASAALEKAQSRPGTFAGVEEFARKNSAEVELRRLQEAQKALEAKLAARAKALEAERGSRVGAAGQSGVMSPELTQSLKTLTETLTSLGKTISEALQPTVDALREITWKKYDSASGFN